MEESRGRGRPRKPGPKLDKSVRIMMTDGERDELFEAAKRRKITVSDFVRRSVNHFVKKSMRTSK